MPPKKKAPAKDRVDPEKSGMAPVSNNSITVAASIGVALGEGASEPSELSSPLPSPEAARVNEMELVEDANEGVASTARSPVAAPSPAANETALVTTNGTTTVTTTSNGSSGAGAAIVPRARNIYENSNLDEITLRQLQEDIDAYQHDLSFCTAQLEEPDLTPQESRTFQMRCLDLGHQIRHCNHRIERLRIEMRGRPMLRQGAYGNAQPSTSGGPNHAPAIVNGKFIMKRTDSTVNPGPSNNNSINHNKRPSSPDETTTTPLVKRPKNQPTPTSVDPDASSLSLFNHESGGGGGEGDESILTLQRLGYWKCRLCEAPKYLLAGNGRTPAAPCKWPLKDVSKMITHFTDMHLEHSPSERCVELGTALNKNRGPFEYWLRRTRQQNVGDGSCMDEAIGMLVTGKMPPLLRKLSRAAAGMASS